MSKIKGLFDCFSDFEKIPIGLIKNKIGWGGDLSLLENELGNRVLYSQVIPATQKELKFDQALLAEMLKIQPGPYFDKAFNRIIIPEIFLNNVPNLGQLAGIFLEAYNPSGCTTIFLKSTRFGSKNLGTLIRPNLITKQGKVEISVSNQKFSIDIGTIKIIPAQGIKEDIQFESKSATLLGRNKVTVEITGGRLGLIIDTRVK